MSSGKASISETADDSIGSPRDKSKYAFLILSAILFGALAFQLWYHAVKTSVTIDEPAHILAGHRHWQCGDFGINPEHPPFLKLLATAPLQSRRLIEPPWECGSKLTSKFDSFSYGNTFLVENGVDNVVIPSRLSASLMSMFLAALVFLAAREMFGRWEALTALAILAFEPNLIAHGSIVTTDMVLTATVFGAVYALYRFGEKQNLFRFLIAGLACGLMLAAKHSAVVFVPVLLALTIADALIFHRAENRAAPRSFVRRTAFLAGIFLIGLGVLWAFYGFRYYSIPSATESTISIADYIRENGRPEMVESFSAKLTGAFGGTRLFPESYVLGMADVIAWGSRNSWIFGRNYSTGQWFYFPIAFAVKSSVAVLLLLPLGFAFSLFNPEKRREATFLLVPPLAFFAVAMTSSFTTGVRHILPVYPFLIVAAAAGAVWSSRKVRFFRYALIALLVFHAAAALRCAPNYLAFANDFWGGTENTHRIFSDSNTDTGQSVKLMNEYLRRENVTDCWFTGFVHPDMARAVQPCRVLPSALRILLSREVSEAVPPVVEGTVFVSVNELPPRGAGEYVPFTRTAPLALIGGNILVYRGRFEIPLAAAMSHAHRAEEFGRLKKTEEAVAEGRRAVALGGGDPRTHLALGLALSRAGQLDEARRALETATELAKPDSVFRNTEVRAQQELRRLSGN
jgi:hypothetical protein